VKYCPKCESNKPLVAFRKNERKKDGLQSICAECGKSYNRKWYDRNQSDVVARNSRNRKDKVAWLKELKRNKRCVRCDESNPACLDFHHTNPDEKTLDISIAVRSWSTKRLMSEIDKCIVLCANCHRKETIGPYYL
jgi:hypothetical protein